MICVASASCGNNFVSIVRLVHNFIFVSNNGHIMNNVYKIGSIFILSCRICMEGFVAKDGSKMYSGYNHVHKIPWVTKVYIFPFAGYIFGNICKSWTQFITR